MDRARGLTRRELLCTLPALTLARSLLAQTSGLAKLNAAALNHLTLRVSDPARSIDFYQRLLGMPIQATQGDRTVLRIGTGPHSFTIAPAGSAPPRIEHLGMSVADFDPDRIVRVLAQHGITPADGPGDGSLSGGAMKVRVVRRGGDGGGSSNGTAEIFFGDPDGIVVQLQDASYCGGAGALGNECSTPPTPPKGLLPVRDLSHFTIMGVADAAKSNAFYQGLFGFPVRANQGASPLLGVGPGVQFVMFVGGGGGRGRGGAGRGAAGGGAARGAAGGGGARGAAGAAAGRGGAGGRGAVPAAGTPARPGGRIDHACLNMENFEVDRILKTLEDFGIKPRGSNPLGPMMSYVSMRMENRGGAPGGTPELYFSDPDGLLIQLQDVKYCGGGGYLGEVCLA